MGSTTKAHQPRGWVAKPWVSFEIARLPNGLVLFRLGQIRFTGFRRSLVGLPGFVPRCLRWSNVTIHVLVVRTRCLLQE